MGPLLTGHTAVVKGAGSGIGEAIAIGYAGEGAKVVCLDIDAERAARTADAIRKAGGTAWSHALDVADRAACAAMAGTVEAEAGQISILVNNAGINRRNPFTGDPVAVMKDWDDIISINLAGTFNVTHAFLAHLKATRGRIVNLASIQAFMHVRTPNSPAYTTSKHGVMGLTRALAAELGKDGIRVNAIGPGLIETPINADARAKNPGLVDVFLQHTPLGRTGQAEDIVGPAIFLASDMAQYVTGSIVMADGGYRTV